MEKDIENDKVLLPHHVQEKLCETRLPYRQGRKLTAVKVYSIASESNHLLIFGVPSLKLRQETRVMFMKFGKLLQFVISKEHAAEPFTETYHAQYEKIQSARIAKRSLDTKNFYGGSLHICYAPELETIVETQQKLIQRQNDVLRRLRNLNKEENEVQQETIATYTEIEAGQTDNNLLNMGEINFISIGKELKRNKRKVTNDKVIEKRFKPCFVDKNNYNTNDNDSSVVNNDNIVSSNVKRTVNDVTEVEIVDCTSADKTTISNINEALNYDKFGDELVFKLPVKPVNKIKFNVNKTSLIYDAFYFKTVINFIRIMIKCHNNINQYGTSLKFVA